MQTKHYTKESTELEYLFPFSNTVVPCNNISSERLVV